MWNYEELETSPNRYFICCALVGLSILIVAFIYPKYCEERASEDHHEDHGHHHHSLKEKLEITFKILSFFRVKKIIWYLFVVNLTAFNYEVMLTYSNEEQFHIKSFLEGSLDTLCFFMSAIALLLYATKFQEVHNKYFCLAALFARIFATSIMAAQVSPDNSSSKAKSLLIVNAAFFTSIVRAFLTMPATVAFAKCTPHSVEAIMMGLLGSIIKMCTEVIARMLGLLALSGKNITIEDYEGLGDAMTANTGIMILGFFSLKYIFSRNEFMDLQQTFENIAAMDRAAIKALNLEEAVKYKK